MVKKLFILFIILLVQVCTKAQPGKEAWHWYFGQSSTLDFSSGMPVAGIGQLSTIEGSASISDENTGQYLFSAAKNYALNKTGNILYNSYGLLGAYSSTQSDLIVRKPGSSTLFYVITCDEAGPANKGVHYSVVDMTLALGLGGVTLKNKVLTPPPCTEKLTGARHCNGVDYWVLTHPFNSNAFNAYLLTSTGLDTVPVVSNTGTVHANLSHYYDEEAGYMKISPDGKKIALGICSDSLPILEILDFNNNTGVVSNPITINTGPGSGPYGVSFSPDNSKLYTTSNLLDNVTQQIFQYDLSSGVAATIIASKTLIAQTTSHIGNYSNEFGALQIAPDGKIYATRSVIDTLAVINNPNNLGAGCNFNLSGFSILPHYSTYSFGLPNFIDANYAGIQLNLQDVKQCGTFNPTTLDAG
ncbi:MAG TPA: hypothetical protein VKG26_05460, partial [Bacteroidia bacterium]|nr:hypothetical protein [Bacteroidia bacterium]